MSKAIYDMGVELTKIYSLFSKEIN